MSRKVLFNSVSGTTLYTTNIVVAFIMSPILIRALGNRDYGLWELVMSVMGYMGLLDLGIGGALVRFVSVADGKQDRDDMQQTVSTAVVFFAIAGVLAVSLFLMLSKSPGLIAGGDIKDIAKLRTVFMLLGVNAAILFPLQAFTATLMGVQRHYFINNVRIIIAICQACLTYHLLLRFQGQGLILLALLTPGFKAIEFLLFAIAVQLDRSLPNISLSAVTIRKAKEMITFAGKSATMLISSRLQNQSVPLIIGHVIGVGQIVYFVMPNRIVEYGKGVALAMGFPLTPYFGAAIGRGDHEELVKSWINSSLALQIVSFAMPVIIFFCGEPFLRLWLGEEYAAAGRIVLYVLIVGLVAESLASNSFRMLMAQGKHGKCALVWLVLSALSIPLGIIGAYFRGIEGVAVGTTMVAVLAHVATLILACGMIQVSFSSYLRNTVLRISLPLLAFTLCFLALSVMYPINTYPDLLIHLSVSSFVYLVSIWSFTLGIEEREKVKARVKLRRRSIRAM